MFTNAYFDKNISCFHYNDEIQKLIIAGKFQSIRSIWKVLAKRMVDVYKKLPHDNRLLIIPVPISKKRYRKRGFNQSNILSTCLAKETNIKIAKNVLIKSSDNQSQSTLTLEKRKTNPLGCYRVNNKNLIDKKHILLIDDVFTTGSTVNECSRILKANGALLVISFTIAKTNMDNL
jgi:ComF family protein